MVNIKECEDRCFADFGCLCIAVKGKKEKCDNTCDFYKPKGCEDWIRIKREGELWIVPPEEYYAKTAR